MKKAFKVVLLVGCLLFVALIFMPDARQIKISDYLKSSDW